MYDRGDLLDGVDNIGAGGEEGIKNGFFYGVARRRTAPAADHDSRDRGSVPLFWTMGAGRRQRTLSDFNAYARAKFPYLMEGDAPDESVMGTSAMDAVDAKVEKLGTLGRKQGIFRFDVSRDFAEKWKSGGVGPGCLKGYTWAIQNHEVRITISRVLAFPLKRCYYRISTRIFTSPHLCRFTGKPAGRLDPL